METPHLHLQLVVRKEAGIDGGASSTVPITWC